MNQSEGFNNLPPEVQQVWLEILQAMAKQGIEATSDEQIQAFLQTRPDLAQKLMEVMQSLQPQQLSNEQYLQILLTLLQTQQEGNQEKIYQVIAQVRNYFNNQFILVMQGWFKQTQNQVSEKELDGIAALLENTCIYILQNPYGCRPQDLKVAIAGLQLVLDTKKDNPEKYSQTLTNLGIAYLTLAQIGIESENNLKQAIACYDESAHIFRELNQARVLSLTLTNLGIAYLTLAQIGIESENNLKQAIACYDESAHIFRELNQARDLSQTLNNLGVAYRNLAQIGVESENNLKQAIACYDESAHIRRELNQARDLSNTLTNLGNAYLTLAEIGIESENNLNQAIACYDESAHIFRELNQARDLSQTLNNLGVAYRNLAQIGVESENNLKQAIACYDESAHIFRELNQARDLSQTLNNLGIAYVTLAEIGIESENNLNQAIACYDESAHIFRELNQARDLSQTLNNLGVAYRNLAQIGVESENNLKQAIACYDESAHIRRELNQARDLSQTLNNLGVAYRNLAQIGIESENNLKQAIACYDESAHIFRELNQARDLSSTLNNLGIAYRILAEIGIESEKNLKQAIACYDESAHIFRELNQARDLSSTLNNLGNAYLTLAEIGIESENNLKQAIACYDESAHIRRELNQARDLSNTLNNLGNAYLTLAQIGIESENNLKQAIACYDESAHIFRELNQARVLSLTLTNLGIAYVTLAQIGIESENNLNQGIAYYREALTLTNILTEVKRTGTNLGDVAFKQGWWEIALEGYEVAIQATEKMRSYLKDDRKRQQHQESALNIYNNALQCYIELKQYDKAILLTERNRCRQLVELMYSNDLYEKGEIPAELQGYLDRHENLQARINQIESQTEKDGDNRGLINSTKSWTRDSDGDLDKQIEELEKLRQEKAEVWQEIRKRDKVLADGLEVPPLELENLQNLIQNQPATALLSFYTVGDYTYVLILRQPSTDTPTGVTLHKCQAANFDKLQGWIYQNWFYPYANYQYIAQIQTASELLAVNQDTVKTIKELRLNSKKKIVEVELEDGSKKKIDREKWQKSYQNNRNIFFNNWLNKISENLTYLSNILELDSLISNHLQGIEELIIIPHIALHLIPFSALPISTINTTDMSQENKAPEYLGDKFQLRILPSAQVLGYCQERENEEHTTTLKGDNYGIVENATEDLWMTKLECNYIVHLLNIPEQQRLKGKKEATYYNYLNLIKNINIKNVHSSHHATCNVGKPLESAIILSDRKLTLAELLAPSMKISQMQEIFLSCCETNLGSPNLTDDILSLGMGFLRSGARAVISSLWAVDDLATAIFSIFYYQNRQQGLNRSMSLQKAQKQLRELEGSALTNDFDFIDQLNEQWEETNQIWEETKDMLAELSQENPNYQILENKEKEYSEAMNKLDKTIDFIEIKSQEEYPFASAYYWSSFICQGIN